MDDFSNSNDPCQKPPTFSEAELSARQRLEGEKLRRLLVAAQRAARRYVRPPVDADEIAQEVVIEQWKSQHLEYLDYRLLRHRAIDKLRRLRTRRKYEEDRQTHWPTNSDGTSIGSHPVDVASDSSGVDQPDERASQLDSHEQREALLNALFKLANLSAEQEHLYYVHFAMDVSIESLAREMNLTVGQVKHRLSDATEKLRLVLRKVREYL